MSYRFEILHKSKRSSARVGRIHTPHGIVDTPGFVAVGTNATLKSLDNILSIDLGTQLLFCNTYHLLLQPGTSIVKKAGGLHAFMNRQAPIITDSGGFQVFSLAYGSVADELKSCGKKKQKNHVMKITEDGVTFCSYRDGEKILLTPETSIQAQKDLGADIIIPFDELPPYHIQNEHLTNSLERTHRWEKRSLEEHKKEPQNQAMWAVIHGGVDPEMRKKSCAFLTSLDFDGWAIGGSLGKTKQELLEVVQFTVPHLPENDAKHLLGIGDLHSVLASIPHGIDTFDSSYPTKAARHGVLLTDNGPFKVTSKKNLHLFTPPVDGCKCPTCTTYTLSYLCHLFKAHELLAYSLATIHNVFYMHQFMKKIRTLITENLL